MLKIIHMNVNGKAVELAIDDRESLLDTLRNHLGLTSVKKGCEVGECSACTVIIDGKACKACVPDTDSLDGREVTGIGKSLVQSPETADETLCILCNRLREITALRGNRTDNGNGTFCTI